MNPISIPTNTLKALAITAAKNDARQYLCGIHVEHIPEYALFLTTDGHRISVARVPYADEPFAAFTIPMSLISALKKNYREDQITCEFGLITIDNNGNMLSAPPITGFPESWRRVIPQGELSGAPAIFNPVYYGDLSKIRKLLGEFHEGTNLVMNGRGLALDQITEDYITGIMPWERTESSPKATTSFPEWLRKS